MPDLIWISIKTWDDRETTWRRFQFSPSERGIFANQVATSVGGDPVQTEGITNIHQYPADQ